MIEVILRAGCEGGEVTLYGLRTAEGWRFGRHLIDQTPTLIDEPQTEHDTPLVASWTKATPAYLDNLFDGTAKNTLAAMT